MRFQEREEVFPFSVVQSRTKFKACVSTCKKAAMMRKTASGLKNFIDKKGYGGWFTKLYPFVESRDSCNPHLAEEPPVRPTVVGKKSRNANENVSTYDDGYGSTKQYELPSYSSAGVCSRSRSELK